VKQYSQVLAVVSTLYVMAVFQQTLSQRVAVLGARPDFLLLWSACLALLLPRSRASLAGFIAGLVHGSMAGMNMAAYISSRTIAAFCASWTKDLRYEVSLPAVAVVAAFTTVLAEILWLFITARPGIGEFLGATIGTAVYNGVLAIPMYALLKRFVDPPRR
jgi:rod shape-determining protein MreD